MRYPAHSTDPYTLPLDVTYVEAWLRVGAGQETQTIERLMRAAMSHAEEWCNQPLFARDYTVITAGFLPVCLPGVQPRNVTISYRLAGQQWGDAFPEQVVTTYDLLREGQVSYPSPIVTVSPAKQVKIAYRAGYETASVPESLKEAVLAFVVDRFDSRGNGVSERTTVLDRLLQPHKMYST